MAYHGPEMDAPLPPDVPASWSGRAFASFRHPAYRLYFSGQLVSLIGMWMQSAAQSWLVYDLTGSKAMLGAVGVAGSVPIVLLSTWGGILADRFNKRGILVATSIGAAIPALILAGLILAGEVHVWHIVALAVILGCVNGIEMPTRQSFVIEMVGRRDLMNAIALNSSVFHGSRIVGPAIAGQVIAAWGTGPCFLANGLSFAAVIAALLAMRLSGTQPARRADGGSDGALLGFRVAARTRGVTALLALILVVGVFGWSYVVLLPVFARDIFAVGPDDYGLLMSATGAGSVIGALGVASIREVRDGRTLVVGAIVLFVAAATGFTYTRDHHLAMVFLAPMGMGMAAFFSSTNTLIQAAVDDEVRGRVMGVYALVFGMMMPLGALQAGGLAEVLGAPLTVRLGASICAVAAVAAWFLVPKGLKR